MSVAVGDIVRITAKMRWFGTDDVQNTYTYRVDLNATLDDDEFMSVVADVLDSAYNNMIGGQSTQFTYDSIDGINLTQDVLLPEVSWPVLVAGASATTIVPQQLAICAFWPTITPKVRTSAFFGGFVIAAIAALGDITPANVSQVLAAANELSTFDTVELDMTKGSLNPVGSIFTPAGTPQVPTRWRTQRRRRIGVGS